MLQKLMKSNHIHTGKSGEAMAASWLQQHDFTILHCNWKHGRYEIDIVAEKNGVLHFVEVKTRRSTRFGFPEESVDRKKFKHLQAAAIAYQATYSQWRRIQYDILAITLLPGKAPEYFFIEDVFI
jgi:putative endonuclease